MSGLDGEDPFLEHIRADIIRADRRRAIVRQPAVATLNNHVAVRHASALYGATYAASRALALSALGEMEGAAHLTLVASEVAYSHLPLGAITSVAHPRGPGWADLASQVPIGGIELGVEVVSRNEDGKTVARVAATWRVEPQEPGPSGR